MPAENARRVVNEMFRILKPGGYINGFDVPYKENGFVRDYFVSSNTWDQDWHIPVSYFFIFQDLFILPFVYFVYFHRATRDPNPLSGSMKTTFVCQHTCKK